MNKRKILLLTDTIAPYRIPVFNLIAEDKTLDFTVLSLTRKMISRQWRLDQASIRFKYRILNSMQFSIPSSTRLPLVISTGLKAALKDINPDLIIIAGYYQPDFLRVLLYCKKKNIKIICWVESNLSSLRVKNNFLYYHWRKWFINNCDAFIVPGTRSREFLLSLNASPKSIFTAPNAIDNAYYHVDLKKKYSQRDKIPGFQKYPPKNFLYVGQLIKRKGVQTLLKAYSRANLGNNFGLILVGAGKGEAYLKNLCRKLKLKNVFFEGFKQSEQLKSYYKLADIFVCPSLKDEWGMVLNEAAIAGLPIISSQGAAASDTLVSEENGWTFKTNDTSELRNCLRNILLSEEELIKRGIESQRKARGHSPQKCACSIIEGINKVLDRKRIIVSSAGILHSHSTARALYNLNLLHKFFTPSIPGNKNRIPYNRVKFIMYPRILFRPVIKIARLYKNISNIFVNLENILFDKRVSRRLKKERFDIFYGFSGSCFYSMLEAKRKGKLCIVDQHDVYYKVADQAFDEEIRKDPPSLSTISYWPPHAGYHKRVDKELELADYILVPSVFSFKTFVDNGIPREKLVLIPLGANSDLRGKAIEPEEKKGFKVGFIGSISLRKGIKYLLNAVKEIGNPDIKVYIAGSFSAKSDILQRYKGCYKLMGYINHSKIADFISGLDVLVLPSLIDSFGLVILEAMARGVPVIASEHTAGPDIIDEGKDGFIVPIRDTAKIKEKILFLYNNREIKIAMGKRALEKVSNFTWDKYAEMLKNLVETANLKL